MGEYTLRRVADARSRLEIPASGTAGDAVDRLCYGAFLMQSTCKEFEHHQSRAGVTRHRHTAGFTAMKAWTKIGHWLGGCGLQVLPPLAKNWIGRPLFVDSAGSMPAEPFAQIRVWMIAAHVVIVTLKTPGQQTGAPQLLFPENIMWSKWARSGKQS